MSDLRSQLRVIRGEGRRQSTWLSPPATVVGRSPFDKDAVMAYRVAVGDVQKHLSANRRQPILDLWWHVYGELPPVPGSERYRSIQASRDIGLHTAHACFRGMMRPVGEDDRGFDFAAFVLKPGTGFRYNPSMACIIEPYTIPADLVYVIYARLDFPEGRAYQNKKGKKPVTNGVVTHWQLVECDPDDPLLPIDHATRFRRQLW